jgi:phage FluMu protein Com
MDGHLDGNSLAGLLSDLLRFEATTAVLRCMSCGDIGAVAEAMVYGGEQGRVVRCRRCDAVLMAVVPTGTGTRVQLRGIAWLEVP